MKRRYVLRKKCLCIGLVILVIVLLFHHSSSPNHTYEIIKTSAILNNLILETAENFTSTSISNCEYNAILQDETTLLPQSDSDFFEGHRIREGGEYSPRDCEPRYSTAVIVPYREKPEQLREFLVYMHTFLRRQHGHYRIYVVEQMDTLTFNRGMLLNIGAAAAIKAGYPCLILHDVELLPLRPANLYACTKCTRQMSIHYSNYGFMFLFSTLPKSAIAITSKQFKIINGYSNKKYSPSTEAKEFQSRLDRHELKLCQFEEDISQFQVNSEKDSSRYREKAQAESTKKSMATDGLNSLKYTEVATVLHPLFTHIMVDLIPSEPKG